MGFLKQMKDVKNTVHEAPGMIARAQQLGAQAPRSPCSRCWRSTCWSCARVSLPTRPPSARSWPRHSWGWSRAGSSVLPVRIDPSDPSKVLLGL